MSIQGSINQLLTMVGTAAMLSPELRANAEAKAAERRESVRLSRKEQALQEARKTQGTAVSGLTDEELEAMDTDPKKQAESIIQQDIAKKTDIEVANVAERQFQLNPTQENLTKATEARRLADMPTPYEVEQKQLELQAQRQRALVEAQAQAELAARQEEMRPKQQRRSFKNVQVDFGDGSKGTVGELPASWQKQINQQLKPKQRKALLDQTEPKETK